MAPVVSWIFLLLVIVAGVFHLAPHVAGRGNYFAVSICSIGGGTLCQHPEYVTMTAAAAGALWVILWSLGR
ncbi:MAG: hypothetical protein M3R18_02445 [Pseudomonadota bacterium]|nr:hypothetical protein [Pseudomonadota bacterium]